MGTMTAAAISPPDMPSEPRFVVDCPASAPAAAVLELSAAVDEAAAAELSLVLLDVVDEGVFEFSEPGQFNGPHSEDGVDVEKLGRGPTFGRVTGTEVVMTVVKGNPTKVAVVVYVVRA